MNSGRNGYKLIQEFKHSLLINNRKFNVRVYLLTSYWKRQKIGLRP